MATGRPSKYKEEFCELLVEHMAKGRSFESFAAVADVDRDTLYEWAKVHESFSDAKGRGQAKSLFHWEGLGLDHVVNVSEHSKDSEGNSSSTTKSLNAAVYNLAMVNRFGYRSKAEGEVDVVVNNVNSRTDAEVDAKLREHGIDPETLKPIQEK